MKALLVIATMAGATASATAAPTALDAWGRYVPAFDLKYKTQGKSMVYVPQGHFYFMVENAESDDIITAQYFEGTKPLGAELKCPVTVEDISGSSAKLAVTHNCAPDLDKHGLSRAAKFTVKIGYRQTAAGTSSPNLAEYTFSTVGHAGAGGTKEFHIDYDFRLGEAWTHITSDGNLNLFAWFKEGRTAETSASKGKMRCFLGDKKWEFSEMTNSRWAHEYDDYAKAKGDPAKVRWTFQYFFPTGDAATWIKENPGDYRCVYTRNGEAEREFFFAIKNGAVVKPKCQSGAKALISTPPSTTYIKQVVKTAQDLKYDAGAYAKSALFGKAGVAAACGF